MSKRHNDQRPDRNYREDDPIRNLWSQSGSFHTTWLKNGESLNILQRTGFMIFSLLFIALGLYFSRLIITLARERDFMVVIVGAVGLGFLVFGVLGLRNVLRFKRDELTK